MKKYFAIIAMVFALVACTGIEQPEPIEEPDTPKIYIMTVKASKAVDTKALSLSGNTLNATWTEDDEVNVYNSNSQLLGTLQAKDLTNDNKSCTLKGTLTTAPSDGETLTLKYHSNSYTGQDGTLAYIASNCDYAVASVTVNVDNSTHNVTTSSPASFVNRQAIAKFTLVDKADATGKLSPSVLNATVSYMGVTLRNYSFDVPNATYTTNGAGVIFLAIPSDIPASVQIGENTFPIDPTKISFTLSATVGSETYTYSKTGFPFENGKYYEITVKMMKALSITSPAVGQVIGNDGKNYADAAAATVAGHPAVAIITYVGSDNGEAAPYNHGLALALSDANGGVACKWSTSNTKIHTYNPTNDSFASESGLQYNDATHNNDTYPAFKAAIANNGTAAPTGCSAWFLASGYQWTKMFADDAYGLKTLAGLKSDNYWSSSERDDHRACDFYSEVGGWNYDGKDRDLLVRSCLAF